MVRRMFCLYGCTQHHPRSKKFEGEPYSSTDSSPGKGAVEGAAEVITETVAISLELTTGNGSTRVRVQTYVSTASLLFPSGDREQPYICRE